MVAAVTFDHVDIVFGERPGPALERLDRGESKDAIFAATGAVIGVADANLVIEEGEIFVLMGLSGSGKSTLLRSVNGLNKVTRGRVLVRDGDGEVDIATCDAATLRRLRMNRISMVFQQFALMPWRTVRDNVAYGLEVRGMPKAERYAKVADVLRLVRLDQWGDKYPHELSGGMQQRVGLARAFATDADILLMDEPFSALDPLIREHLQDELLEYQQRLRKTILFVSHDLDEALKIGTRIAIMEAARIVQVGRPEDIVNNPSTDYVRQFVANVNPLNVLRAASLLRPVSALPRAAADVVVLDRDGRCKCRLDAEGRVLELTVDGAAVRVCVHGKEAAAAGDDGVLLAGTPETPMRVVIEARHQSGHPMPIVDDEHRLVGVVGEPELLAGMLRRGAPALPAPGHAAEESETTPEEAPPPERADGAARR